MIFRATFCDADGVPIRQTVFNAEDQRQAVSLLRSTLDWPEDTWSLELETMVDVAAE